MDVALSIVEVDSALRAELAWLPPRPELPPLYVAHMRDSPTGVTFHFTVLIVNALTLFCKFRDLSS